MFKDLMGMMGQLNEAREKVEAAKKRLDTVLIDQQSTDGLLQVTFTANSALKSVTVSQELLADKDQLEDYLVLVINKALDRAKAINEAELAAAAKDGLPNIPGMDRFR